jgi:hypothetical protein
MYVQYTTVEYALFCPIKSCFYPVPVWNTHLRSTLLYMFVHFRTKIYFALQVEVSL